MPMDLKKVFSLRVRKALGTRSQNWLADEIGVSAKSLSFYLNEERSDLPKAEVLRALCEALDVSADYLLGLPQPIIPSSRIEMLYHVQKATTSMYGIHYAVSPEDVHRWTEGDMNDFFEANQRLVATNRTVERIFLLRKYAFLDPQTKRFDENSKQIINLQGKYLSAVYVVWEEEAKKWQANEEMHSKVAFDPSNSNILVNFVVVDEDILFLNRRSGYTVLTWVPDITRCALRIDDHLTKYNILKSLAKDVTKDAAWWI